MSINKTTALHQLDIVLAEWERRKSLSSSPAATNSEIVKPRMRSVIKRLAPAGSAYHTEARADNEFTLAGVVKALRADYEAGFLQTYRELLNADLFSDFLSMADFLLQDGMRS